MASRFTCARSGPPTQEIQAGDRPGRPAGDVHREICRCLFRQPDLECHPVRRSELYGWDDDSTYIQEPPFFVDLTRQSPSIQEIREARVLAVLGDSITTDHISPAGSISADSPAGKFLIEQGVAPRDFNSYGSRRGNDRVMTRGTFANIRLKNRMLPGVEGGVTVHLPDGEQMSIYDAAMQYQEEGVPLVVLAGKEYGTGSSRDWAAKGTLLLGVRAVIAEIVRAHPPLQPGRDGRAAAGVQSRRERRKPGIER